MLKQEYPFFISVFKDKDRFLINPFLVTTGEFKSNSPWIKIIDNNDPDIAVKLGQCIIEAAQYIKNSPVLDIKATEDLIGEFIHWKKENKYKSWNEFDKKNVHTHISLREDGSYEIYSMKRIKGNNGYNGSIKAFDYKIYASVEEIGLAIIDVTAAAEEFYKKK